MGRPPKPLADKRALATFRMIGAARDKVEKAAAEAGRSIAAELEARVMATIDLDEAGLQLVQQISSELQAAANVTGEPTWHSTLTSWAAAREMLLRGPIERFRPHRMSEDPEFAEAMDRHRDLLSERRQLITELATMGIAMPEEPKPKDAPVKRGLFGMGPGQLLNSREIWRARVASLEPSEDRDSALAMIDKLVALDGQIDAAWQECSEQISLFRKDETEGREAYRRRLIETARRQFDAGEPYSVTDYFSLWQN